MIPPPQPKPILSPCVGICTLRPDGLCEGCLRTGHEIARWLSMTDEERRFVMEHTLPVREVACR
jgi:predicted Fe-S protein YdhL (DUF1289 family)